MIKTARFEIENTGIFIPENELDLFGSHFIV